MTSIITRSSLIAAIRNTVEDSEAQNAAINAVNRLYINEHAAHNINDDESLFFNLVTNYDHMHACNPNRYNQNTLEEAAHNAFLY